MTKRTYDYAVTSEGAAHNFTPTNSMLKLLVDAGRMIKHSKQGVVTARLFLRDGVYVMENTGGEHRLKAQFTNEERLSVHWKGFCETSDAVSEHRIWKGK